MFSNLTVGWLVVGVLVVVGGLVVIAVMGGNRRDSSREAYPEIDWQRRAELAEKRCEDLQNAIKDELNKWPERYRK